MYDNPEKRKADSQLFNIAAAFKVLSEATGEGRQRALYDVHQMSRMEEKQYFFVMQQYLHMLVDQLDNAIETRIALRKKAEETDGDV